MATSEDYIKYICGQIRGFTDVIYKKMFGEYIVYINAKPVLLVCDNTVFVKKLSQLNSFENLQLAYPYEGAKEHYILDVDDIEVFNEIVAVVEKATPFKVKK